MFLAMWCHPVKNVTDVIIICCFVGNTTVKVKLKVKNKFLKRHRVHTVNADTKALAMLQLAD